GGPATSSAGGRWSWGGPRGFPPPPRPGGRAQRAARWSGAPPRRGGGGRPSPPPPRAVAPPTAAGAPGRARPGGSPPPGGVGGGAVMTGGGCWRWGVVVKGPIGGMVVLASPLFLPQTGRQPGHFDVAGALTSTAGMASLVYGIIRAASDGWSDKVALTAFAAAVILLAGFLYRESRAHQPITPLPLFADRQRAGSYLTRLLLVGGMFGMFFFLTQLVQDILGFSPLQAGISFLPMTVALLGVSQLSPRLVSRFRPWTLMVAGML